MNEEATYLKDYLSGLVGGTIVQVEAADDGDGGIWPVLIVQDKEGNIIQLEASQDAEGNGPGHIFIGLLKGENYDEYYRISDKKSWEMLWAGIQS